MVNLFFRFFCLFFCFSAPLLGSSFDDLDDSIRDIVLDQHRSHKQTIDTLRGGLLKFQADFSVTHGGAGSTVVSSPKSGSSKFSKSVMQNWQDVNFAMGSLIVVKTDGSQEIIPVQGVGVKVSEGEPTIYDSCSDRTCNMLQDTDVCINQWRQYLGDSAKIFSSGTEKVRGLLTGDRDDSPLREIQVNVLEIKRKLEETEPLSWDDFKQINNQIMTYQSLLSNTWVPVGWHSEQRIICDLDGEPMKDRLRGNS